MTDSPVHGAILAPVQETTITMCKIYSASIASKDREITGDVLPASILSRLRSMFLRFVHPGDDPASVLRAWDDFRNTLTAELSGRPMDAAQRHADPALADLVDAAAYWVRHCHREL